MVNTTRLIASKTTYFDEGQMGKYMSFSQTFKELGISRGSLYKYIAEGRISAKREELGDEIIFKFQPEEVKRFKDLIDKRWTRGKSRL